MRRQSLTLLLALALLVSAGAVSAADGVLEINQTCAVQTGCFAGDTPAFPVTISQPGSYRLTSNLTKPDVNADGLLVVSGDVQIDLNGFTIDGSCAPIGCGGGAGRGILVLGDRDNVRIRNGIIKRNAREGIKAADAGAGSTHIESLNVLENKLMGIWINSGIIRNSIVTLNGGNGINLAAGLGSLVVENAAHNNAGTGISVSTGTTVSGNTVYLNEGDGIFADSGSTISGNTAFFNIGGGISTIRGSTVSGNTAYQNTGGGIGTLDGCTVENNTLRLNGGYGLTVIGDSSYRGNTISSNTSGTVDGGGINAGGNVCNGSLTCP